MLPSQIGYKDFGHGLKSSKKFTIEKTKEIEPRIDLLLLNMTMIIIRFWAIKDHGPRPDIGPYMFVSRKS
jgi:hypothetical protein